MSLVADIRVEVGALVLQVSFELAPGRVVAVLGPNGAGKTTLLRTLCGLRRPTEGRVELDGSVLDDTGAGVHVPAEDRSMGLVFQDGLLFPGMSALDNVAFGLRCRGVGRREARRAARAWLDRMGLAGMAGRRPSELSGGQAQRVALARALAPEPRLLLLDEPLAALDVTSRASLRRELGRHLREWAGIPVVVTHDPIEALALAERLLIVEDGRLVQDGDSSAIAARPRTRYVADLVGVNWYEGTGAGDRVRLGGGAEIVAPDAGTGRRFAVIHPRSVTLHLVEPEGSARNVWEGRVEHVESDMRRARVSVRGRLPIVAEVTYATVAELGLSEGLPVWAAVKATEISTYGA